MSKNYANEHPKYKKKNQDKNIKVAGAGNTVVLSYAKKASEITGKTLAYFKMNPEEAYEIYLDWLKKNK
jgi:hypothetical protein